MAAFLFYAIYRLPTSNQVDEEIDNGIQAEMLDSQGVAYDGSSPVDVGVEMSLAIVLAKGGRLQNDTDHNLECKYVRQNAVFSIVLVYCL